MIPTLQVRCLRCQSEVKLNLNVYQNSSSNVTNFQFSIYISLKQTFDNFAANLFFRFLAFAGSAFEIPRNSPSSPQSSESTSDFLPTRKKPDSIRKPYNPIEICRTTYFSHLKLIKLPDFLKLPDFFFVLMTSPSFQRDMRDKCQLTRWNRIKIKKYASVIGKRFSTSLCSFFVLS